VCRTVCRADPAIRGIILTAYTSDQETRAAADAGASGCVVKQLLGLDRRVAAGGIIGDEVAPASGASGR
jgi:hypothetical protein